MLRNHLYYQLKPYLPRRLRMVVRRMLARRKRGSYKDIWPINEAAGRPPDGWPGWPEGKKFALVLTHDVEGRDGLAKCRDLMKLEMELGFRSSFYFIPEGDYIVPSELRAELTQNGFEVGVHDLHHDGKLYRSRRDFAEKAVWINRYLKDWGAVGFRSGFMFHNLDWLHDLDILYDASTFDTDPFEPQPDGTGTIFPFWVAGPDGRGCVELPYTLPQDSTLFRLLDESSPAIWKRKLDWIVQRGGMALVDVHPDYMCFQESADAWQNYPSTWYRDFLEYVAKNYPDLYWHALPREIAEFCSAIRPVKRMVSRRRICMLSHSIYETDNRVRRYAETLAEQGDMVDAVCLRRDAHQPQTLTMDGVCVHRIQTRSRKDQKGPVGYLLPLLRFWATSSAWLTCKHIRRRYDLIHVHNVPDFLVFAAWFPKLTGTKVILDIHDIVPEFYASKFHLGADSFSVKVLAKIERASAWFADHVIVSNHLWHKTLVSRSAPENKCSVLINHVNQKVFRRRDSTVRNGKTIIMFPGGLQWHQGLDIAIRAFSTLTERIPEAEFHIYGDGSEKDALVALTRDLCLTGKVRFFDLLPLQQIAQVMANADLGVVPKRADSFGNEAYSTKIMEFMSVGIPVVVSDTKIDRYYFNDSIVRFFESGNPNALAAAMWEVLRSEELRRQMVTCASEYVVRNNWESRKADYLALVDDLCARK